MAENSKLHKLKFLMITAALTAGFGKCATTAFADDAVVSEKDMLLQAVSLFEKLSGTTVAVPDPLMSDDSASELSKAVILGFTNADELDTVSEETGLRKQDAMTVLYKTIINFDDSFALSTDEVDEIMNKCYDNALIDEENRVGYAFMLKHGIITEGSNTEPNKEITWSSCRILVDVLYDLFMQDITFEAGDISVNIGANIETVTDTAGQPDRIDKSGFGFDWYIYNSDYDKFMMVGVDEGRICSFFSNSMDFGTDAVKVGNDYLLSYKYAADDGFRFFEDKDGKIDAVLYNPRSRESADMSGADISACEIVDMINAYRSKNGLEPLKISEQLWEKVASMPSQPKYIELAGNQTQPHTVGDVVHETGCDEFSVYSKLILSNDKCIGKDVNAIGAATFVKEDFDIVASITSGRISENEFKNALVVSEENINILPALTVYSPVQTAEKTTADVSSGVFADITNGISDSGDTQTVDSDEESTETTSPEDDTKEENTTDENAAAVSQADDTASFAEITSNIENGVIRSGSNPEINLKNITADEYYIRIYSFEDDEYIVNSYMKPTDSKLSFEADMFDDGKDYSIEITALSEDGTEQTEEFVVQYGEIPQDSVKIITPSEKMVTDNDFIELEWESEIYHDFVIDIYSEDGKLILSQPVTDSDNARIKNVDPGTYYIYVNAVRRGDNSEVKTHAGVIAEIKLPEPVITEYILENGEKFYPVYEDTEMGILCFYDEDIVDAETVNANGKTVTVKKKKITEKQVKSTNYYRQLAQTQQKVEYFEGGSELSIVKPTTVTDISSSDKISVSDSSVGQAIVDQAAKYLGVPYVWGGTTPNGFDCSGLVQYVLKELGIDISRVSQTQYKEGTAVSREELQPGDLVFFQKNGDVHHVGIYVGNGTMIHAPHTGAVVQYQSIDTPYYSSQFCGGRRVY